MPAQRPTDLRRPDRTRPAGSRPAPSRSIPVTTLTMSAPAPAPERPPLLREALGAELRAVRAESGRTLRDVAVEARVSPGYLSEIERGRKEASSELLASVSTALAVPLEEILVRVAAELGGRRVETRAEPALVA